MAKTTLAGVVSGDGPESVVTKWNAMVTALNAMLAELYMRGTESAAIPTEAGTLKQIVWNSEPASGEAVGWVYTAGGWKAFGTIAA